MAMGDIGLKARVLAKLLGSTKDGFLAPTIKDPTTIDFDALFSYDLGFMKFFFGAGVAIALPDVGDVTFGWHVNPYITKSVGPGTFFAGIRADSDGSGDKMIVNIKVPIAIIFGF
jgi:hypothetical protein